jgi:hypothetical protein
MTHTYYMRLARDHASMSVPTRARGAAQYIPLSLTPEPEP